MFPKECQRLLLSHKAAEGWFVNASSRRQAGSLAKVGGLQNPRWPMSYSLFNFISFISFLSHKKEQKGPAHGTFESLTPLLVNCYAI